MKRVWIAILALGALLAAPAFGAFDQQHRAWDTLLKKHVVWVNGGTASRVNYAAFEKDRIELKRYLDSLSAVTPPEFDGWTRSQQLAFLLNAYNAFTVELILGEYPKIKSIRDIGGVFGSPWKKRFFMLLGKSRHLDDIEHGMIRARGVYDDPRIHMAAVCASIGCPGIRTEAFTAARLDAQLEDSVVRFLSDRSRNRYNPGNNTLEVSSIFDWYERDFSSGFKGYTSVDAFLAKYADALADAPESRARIRNAQAVLRHLDYDWALNDTATLSTAASPKDR
ncbi:MAG: DUF547 domain-containing protein [Betaproteobacteria bacterium]|nr:DUF547 domain-containing protein [Betaproteobacteria bacterium]